ncbi:hypothetical protein Tco_1165184 [Tanacetum coccineum]
MEQVFEICKCAEDDKVKFAMCTFEGRALTWWNGNVQTLGLANANQIPWSNVKAMMTTEYCPATESQRMGTGAPQLEERFMLEIYQNVIGATYIYGRVFNVSEMPRFGHLEKDCRTRLQGAGNGLLANVICAGVE